MIEHSLQVRVRYAETDQMGFVYYGNYATYLEVARVDTFRELGFTYREMEEEGILMPVLEYKTKFIRPAHYDDNLTIKVFIKEKPGLRIKFEYEIYNEANTLLNVCETTLVFISKETGKPTLPTGRFKEIMETPFQL